MPTSDTLDGFTCPLSEVKPLSKWVEQEVTEKSCPPCLISPLASYYLGVLEEAGDNVHANHLKREHDRNPDKSESKALTIASVMDKIKLEVGDDLRKKLIALDCFAQSYKD